MNVSASRQKKTTGFVLFLQNYTPCRCMYSIICHRPFHLQTKIKWPLNIIRHYYNHLAIQFLLTFFMTNASSTHTHAHANMEAYTHSLAQSTSRIHSQLHTLQAIHTNSVHVIFPKHDTNATDKSSNESHKEN